MGTAATRYEIRRHVTSGGISRLLLAFDRQLKREVALKVVVVDQIDADSVHELEREATILAGFNHPNIVSVHDSGLGVFDLPTTAYDAESSNTFTTTERHSCFYIVEDYIRGYDLSMPLGMMRERSETRKIWPRRKILRDWLLGALQALAYAHQRGIVHRDVKPKNIMIDEGTDGIFLIDFGLAKRFSEPEEAPRSSKRKAGGPQETIEGTIKATPWYASPEQARGETKEIDPRSDLYSFGATMYEAVTLRLPFEDKDVFRVLERIATEDPPRPEAKLAAIPEKERIVAPVAPALSDIIMRCLARDKASRYPDAEALKRDLIRFLIRDAPAGVLRRWKQGDVIVNQGDRGDELYYLVVGRVGVERDGRQINIVEGGEWIGFAPLTGSARSATVRAMEDCEGYVFSGVTDERVLYKAVADDPAMAVSLIKSMARPYSDGRMTESRKRE